MSDTEIITSDKGYIPSKITFTDINRLWDSFQKNPGAIPLSLSDSINLPTGIEAISISSDEFAEEIRMIKDIFTRMTIQNIEDHGSVIARLVTKFMNSQAQLIENKKITSEEGGANTKKYIKKITDAILIELLVKEIGLIQIKFLNSICATNPLKDEQQHNIPKWKIHIGNVFRDTLRSFMMENLLTEETIFRISNNLGDIRYSDISQESCDPKIRTENEKWHESLNKTIRLINIITRPEPKIPGEYYFIIPVAMQQIFNKLIKYLTSDKDSKDVKYDNDFIENKCIVITEVFYRLFDECPDIITKLKQNPAQFPEIYDKLLQNQNNYRQEHRNKILDLLNR